MAQVNVHEIHAEQFILALAEELKKKKEFESPAWAFFVKTGVSKARPPERADWWYVRAASILRALYVEGIIGTEKLRIKYGSRKNRGMAPERFEKASGKIIRTILQQATKAGLVEHIKGKRTGRKLTKPGKEWLEQIAGEIKK
jgi:small subunit ribosomal protein S19e